MSMKSESELIGLLKDGDVKAMEPLMQQYKDYVYTIVIQMVKNNSVAEELTQDVFVKVFKKIDSYQEKSKFSTWLYTVTYRTCLNYLEKKKIVFNMSDISASDENTENTPDFIMDQEFVTSISEVEEKERQRIIWQAIDEIPEQQGVIITLHYLQQFSVKEIADLMGVPDNTVKTHLFRGRNSIRLNLEKYFSREELL